MSKKITLSKPQKEVIKLLREGYKISFTVAAIVSPQGYNVKVNKATLDALFYKRLCLNGTLTDLGRNAL